MGTIILTRIVFLFSRYGLFTCLLEGFSKLVCVHSASTKTILIDKQDVCSDLVVIIGSFFCDCLARTPMVSVFHPAISEMRIRPAADTDCGQECS